MRDQSHIFISNNLTNRERARDGLYVSSFDQTLTFQSLAKWALANMNYYTNLTHAPGIVTNHAPLWFV